ncbi:hypothetical protein F5148DRAFT_985380 [Russula earlei]|uniref:Uncharacterized protein n=1 Tax=Russula earlei TaxID=71964 RepID=A0ACC0TZK4_9AGAM|nr:hypothetical protein F5148DRAFT_985380 [Russula earlei]
MPSVPVSERSIDVCLCLSALPLFIETDVVAILAVTLAGEDAVTGILTKLILGAAPKTSCVYPPHSTPACVGRNPCGFQCEDGYSPSPPVAPTTCACPPPNVVCNDNWLGSGSCAETGPGWTACGVFGGGRRAWECVNTARDLESCGGCVLPLTPYSPIGTDCTTLPGVADVSCISGECVVHRCLHGYTHSRDGTSCVPKNVKIPPSHIPNVENDIGFVPAGAYGLEHVPLDRNY